MFFHCLPWNHPYCSFWPRVLRGSEVVAASFQNHQRHVPSSVRRDSKRQRPAQNMPHSLTHKQLRPLKNTNISDHPKKNHQGPSNRLCWWGTCNMHPRKWNKCPLTRDHLQRTWIILQQSILKGYVGFQRSNYRAKNEILQNLRSFFQTTNLYHSRGFVDVQPLGFPGCVTPERNQPLDCVLSSTDAPNLWYIFTVPMNGGKKSWGIHVTLGIQISPLFLFSFMYVFLGVQIPNLNRFIWMCTLGYRKKCINWTIFGKQKPSFPLLLRSSWN